MFGRRKNSGLGLILAFAGTLLVAGGGLRPAYAQFVCDSADAGEDGQGANADGNANNTACGNSATASGGVGSANTAVGASADAAGEQSQNTAIGESSEASGDDSANTSVGSRANASGDGSSNSASGLEANASGDVSGNVANGGRANASGDGSTNMANGFAANASGNDSENIAIGSGASAAGDGTANIAVGAGARAEGANSTAIGAGAVATRDGQMAFGNANNTYTMGGITSDASKAAQQGPLEIVTTDAFGNLASDGGAFQRQIDALGKRDDELAEGIAIALALDAPNLQTGQSFAFRLGYGNLDGSSALGVAAAGLLDKGSFGDSSTITLDGGVGFGTTKGTVAGKAGLTFGW